MQNIRIPAKTLVVLCGPAGAGKSTFAMQHFQPTQAVSSDMCRGLICDRPYQQGINRQTFELFHHLIRLRLSLGRLTVADSTALETFARAELLALAREANYSTCLLVFAVPLETCRQQNSQREKPVPDEVVIQQHWQLRQSTLRQIYSESWEQRHIFETWPHDLQFTRALTKQRGRGGASSIEISSR